MQQDLALLPLWFAGEGDYIWVETPPDLSEFQWPNLNIRLMTKQTWMTGATPLPELTAMPWGLSPQIINYFEELSNAPVPRNLRIPEWKDEYIRLTSRETAAECLRQIWEKHPNHSLPEIPLFFRSMDELENYMLHHSPPFVIKTPYSSSGRGLIWERTHTIPVKDKEWISGGIKKQRLVSIEKGLEKIQDFAMEFYLDPTGKASYQGLSVFSTDNGTYNGNILESQALLEQRLRNTLRGFQLSTLSSQLIPTIEAIYGGLYSGYLGIDMMIYKTDNGDLAIHPCVEINMRYTMGLVAIRLFEQYLHPVASGRFHITYEKDAYQKHLQMKKYHPAIYENRRLLKGYLPLCPVKPETCYRAFVIV